MDFVQAWENETVVSDPRFLYQLIGHANGMPAGSEGQFPR